MSRQRTTPHVRCRRRGHLANILILCFGSVALVNCSESEVVPAPDHEIVEVNDSSFAGARRLSYVVQLPEVYSEEQMLQIASWIVDDRHKKNDLVNAVAFQFYFSGSHIKYDPADGVIHWAPDGAWSKAGDVRAGNYRNFRFQTLAYWEGLTTDEAEALLSVPVSGDIVGRWYKHGPLKSILTIFQKEGKTFYDRRFSIESSSVYEISEVSHDTVRRFNWMPDSPDAGGYLVITLEGDLHFFNGEDKLFMIAGQVDSEETTVSSPQ